MKKQVLPWRRKTMEPACVYRMDYKTKAEMPHGTFLERR